MFATMRFFMARLLGFSAAIAAALPWFLGWLPRHYRALTSGGWLRRPDRGAFTGP
jgi:hypothetical protein